MSTELYIPDRSAKLDSRSMFYPTTDTFKRRSEHSKRVMTEYWSDKRHRTRIDKKQAKPVDVFDLEGHYIRSFKSSRKAAIAMFPEKDYRSVERVIRNCRTGKNKQYRGFMFRDHTDNPTDIEPIAPVRRKNGYKVNRRPGTYYTRPVLLVCDDGDIIRFNSVGEAAAALHGTSGGIWVAIKQNRKYKRIFKPQYADSE